MDLNQDFIEVLLENSEECSLQLPDPSLVQYYYDLANRTIWIDGQINASTLDIVSKILKWNRDDVDKSVEERQPIKFFFLSPGGDLDIQETIVSVIRLSKTPIYGIAMGMVASAASLIYLSCHKRFALPNAYLVIHQGSAQMSGNHSDVVSAMQNYIEQVESMTKFYIKNTNYTEEEIRENIKKDWYVKGDELLEKGLITNWVTNISDLL